MCKIKDELIKRQDKHEEFEDYEPYEDPYMEYINQEVKALKS